MPARPKTCHSLTLGGYVFKNLGYCRGCNAPIEWWHTPSGKAIPFNPMHSGEDEAVAHFATCPKVKDFRKKG